jgi:hypothetical protein
VKLGRNTKRRLVFYGSLGFAIGAFTIYCSAMPGESFRGAPPPLDPREDAYELQVRAHVTMLAKTIGERNTRNPKQLHDAADYLETTLRADGFTVHRHPYSVDDVTCDTLDADLAGTEAPRELVVVGAHYDSAEYAPGADDNASGSAAVLALAHTFKGHPLRRTVRFALFVNEEPPYFGGETMGSAVYAREIRARGDDVVAMVSLESIGYFDFKAGSQHYPAGVLGLLYPNRGDFVAFVGDLHSRALVRDAIRVFRATAHVASEGGALPAALPGVDWSDHKAFRDVGYPAMMLTDTAPFRNPNYHKFSDTLETIDYSELARVTAGVEDLVKTLASRALP